MKIIFTKLTNPTIEIADVLNKWENNPAIVPFIRPIPSQEDLVKKVPVTVESLTKRLERNQTFLIYNQGQLIGEMNYQVDPDHLYKKVPGTAWIGIDIGEK